MAETATQAGQLTQLTITFKTTDHQGFTANYYLNKQEAKVSRLFSTVRQLDAPIERVQCSVSLDMTFVWRQNNEYINQAPSVENCIYFVLNGRNLRILYVGITQNLRARFKGHRRSGPLHTRVLPEFTVIFFTSPSNGLPEFFERWLLDKYNFDYNTTHNTHGPDDINDWLEFTFERA